MPHKSPEPYRITMAVNRLYSYTEYRVTPAIEDKIVYELGMQALLPMDEDPHPREIDNYAFTNLANTWAGRTILHLSGALSHDDISARGDDLKVAFQEMGLEVERARSYGIESDAPY